MSQKLFVTKAECLQLDVTNLNVTDLVVSLPLPGMPGGPSGASALDQSEASAEAGRAVIGGLVHRWKAAQEQEDQSMEGEG